MIKVIKKPKASQEVYQKKVVMMCSQCLSVHLSVCLCVCNLYTPCNSFAKRDGDFIMIDLAMLTKLCLVRFFKSDLEGFPVITTLA